MWITVIAILIYLEILQVGLFFMLKGSAEKPGLSIFVPVYGLKYITRTGKIKILSVPVEKPFGFFAELLVIAFLCALYWKWGVDNLTIKAYTWLGQIMVLPVVICLGLCYLAVVKSALNVCGSFSGWKRVVCAVLSFLILPVPFIYSAKGFSK